MKVQVFNCDFDVNTYVVSNGNQAIVVDPGYYMDEVIKYLKDNKLDCKSILITHFHFDHVGGVAKLIEQTGATAYMSSIDHARIIRDEFIFEPVLGFPVRYVEPFKVQTFEDGHILNINGFSPIKIMLTPGHTKGGVCFIFDEDNVMFTGDTLFYHSYGRTDFPESDEEEMYNSLKKLFSLNKDYVVYPGHMSSTTLFTERDFFGKFFF